MQIKHLTGMLICCALNCGDDGQAVPGVAEPCNTMMAAALQCRPNASGSTPSIEGLFTQACQHLIGCGILAQSHTVVSTSPCPANDDACRRHNLDYTWCLQRFNAPQQNPCTQQPYSDGERQSAAQCIVSTNCQGLGLKFPHKIGPINTASAADTYNCDNNQKVRTATSCDYGLLAY